MNKFLVAIVGGLCTVSCAIAQQPSTGAAMAVMGQECLMNHPITAQMEVTMSIVSKNTATAADTASPQDKPAPQPFNVKITGEVDRDSDGRTRFVMRVPLPGMNTPLAMTSIMDPIEKRVVALDDTKKTYTVVPLAFSGSCSQHVPTAADFDAAFKQAGMDARRLDDRQIGGYTAVGYSISIPDKLFGKDASMFTEKPAITLWMDTEDAMPLEMRMGLKSDKMDMDMLMQFTHVHRVETPVAAFGIPEGFTENKPQTGAGAKP